MEVAAKQSSSFRVTAIDDDEAGPNKVNNKSGPILVCKRLQTGQCAAPFLAGRHCDACLGSWERMRLSCPQRPS